MREISLWDTQLCTQSVLISAWTFRQLNVCTSARLSVRTWFLSLCRTVVVLVFLGAVSSLSLHAQGRRRRRRSCTSPRWDQWQDTFVQQSDEEREKERSEGIEELPEKGEGCWDDLSRTHKAAVYFWNPPQKSSGGYSHCAFLKEIKGESEMIRFVLAGVKLEIAAQIAMPHSWKQRRKHATWLHFIIRCAFFPGSLLEMAAGYMKCHIKII